MPKFNIYKIPHTRRIALNDKFDSIGLTRISSIERDNFTFDFYFSMDNEGKEIWWAELYRDFLGDIVPRNIVHFACLLLSQDELLYAVSLGKSHFYLNEYCDLDFGIDIGTRLIDENYINLKDSRLFGGTKKKAIVSYKPNTEIDIDSAESISFLKGKTVSPEIFGKNLNCGVSASFSIREYSPLQLPSLINSIEERLANDALFEIPRSNQITNEREIIDLDIRLISDIVNNRKLIEINDMQLSGVEFIFYKDAELELVIDGDNIPITSDASLEDVNSILNNHGTELTSDNINEIKIKVIEDTGRNYRKPLKYFIDYIDEQNHYLQDGKWVCF